MNFKKLALAFLMITLTALSASAQSGGPGGMGGIPYAFNTPLYTGTVVPGAQQPMSQYSLVVSHQLSWIATGTVSSCTVQLEGSASANGTYTVIGVAQTCTASGTYTVGGTAPYVRLNITAFSATGSVSFQYVGSYYPPSAGTASLFGAAADGFYTIPQPWCTLSVPVTGVFAANPASSGTFVGPALVQAQTANTVYQVTTTAAASAVNANCDITAPSRLTTGNGITITGYDIWYAIQTTALTSITPPTVNTITYPVVGGAAAGVVAPAGGVLTTTPSTLQLATTTSGSCYTSNVTFGTPFVYNNPNQRLETNWIFNQTAASAEVIQICGIQVYYTINSGVFLAQGTGSGGASAPFLGTASTYSINAQAAITNTGNTTIAGNVALNPGSSITGFPPGTIAGRTDVDNANAIAEQSDLLAAWNFLQTPPPGGALPLPANMAGLRFAPGYYANASSTGFSGGTVTLDAGGNPNAVFVFKAGTTIITDNSALVLINGAQAKNVFWVAGSSVTLGETSSSFSGIVMAAVSITATGGSNTITGRLFAGAAGNNTGAVTFSAATIVTNP